MPDKMAAPKLNMTRFHEAAQERNVWRICPELGTPESRLMEPDFWSHVSMKLRPGDKIEAFAEDGTWYAEYLVMGCDRLWAKVHRTLHEKLTTADVSETQAQTHSVEWKGPQRKFAIIRKEDNEIVRDGFQVKDDAIAYLKDYLVQIA